MARFSLRPKMRNTQANQDVISIPEPVDDNHYLAASAQAAIADKTSGAYDQYMFTDSELRQMPYETAVDTHLQLVSTRLKQRYGRTLTAKRNQVALRENAVQRAHSKKSLIKARLEATTTQIETHRSILAGETEGNHGLNWIGHEPDFLGVTNARIRLAIHALIFVAIGVVDVYVIWRSFMSMQLPAVEAGFLTAPAVAAQLAFPHLAGTRLAKLVRGAKRRVWLVIEIVILLGVWFVFIYVMSYVRVQFILQEIKNNSAGGRIDAAYPATFLLLNLVLLTALGGWLIFIAIRENPHERAILASKLKAHQLSNAHSRAEKKLAKKAARLVISENNLAAIEEELENSVLASRLELSEAAKAVYRRALVNQLGSVDFTAAYLSTTNAAEQLESNGPIGRKASGSNIERNS